MKRKTIVVINILMIFFLVLTKNSKIDNLYINDVSHKLYSQSNEVTDNSLFSITTSDTTIYYDTLTEAIANVPDNIETTITVLKNFEIDAKYIIPANKNIIIDGNNKVVTRKKNNDDTYYTDTFIQIDASAILTIKNLTFDEGNKWLFEEEKYEAAVGQKEATTDTDAFVKPNPGAPIITNRMYVNSGKLTFDNVTVKNQYSKDKGVYQGKQDSTVIFKNFELLNCASKNTALLSITEAKNANVFIEEGTLIDGNYTGGNGGIFKVYSGSTLTINGGKINNTKALNSNGIVAMAYQATIIFNNGIISNNSGVRGVSNTRNSTIYIHNGGKFYMNGGVIEKNRGTSMGAVDVAGYSNSIVELNGGEIKNNVCALNEKRSDVYIGADYNLNINKDVKIDGNIYVYGNVTNNGTINGDITLDVMEETEKKTIEGDGKITGDIVIYYDKNNPPDIPVDKVNGNLVLCETNDQVLLKFYYNGGIDKKGLTHHGLISVNNDEAAIPPEVYKKGHHVEWYLDEELTEKWNSVSLPNKSHLYAKWIPNEYTITWNISGKETTQTYKYGELIKALDAPVKEGFTFAKWSNYSTGMTMPDENITFTAEFKKEEKKILPPDTSDFIYKCIIVIQLDIIFFLTIVYLLRKSEAKEYSR